MSATGTKATTVRSWVVALLAGALLLGCGEDPGHDLLTDDLAEIGSRTSALTSDSLSAFAAKCDKAIGLTVPTFNCDNGTEPAVTNFKVDGVSVATPKFSDYRPGHMSCDRPNRLNQECDPQSKFLVIANDPDAAVVAHCRKKGDDPGMFTDIAVIQWNKRNGATCFYQNTLTPMSGNMPAPSAGGGSVWAQPGNIQGIDPCVSCHDNGPIVRSPYLTQITGANQLPGAGDVTFNRNQPYYFVGADFQSWRAFKAEVPGNLCVSCHRLGVNNQNGNGTAIDLGVRATSMSEAEKNPASTASPMWMPPNQTSFSQANLNLANAVAACGARRTEAGLPFDSSCRISKLTGPLVAPAVGSPAGYRRADTVTGTQSSAIVFQNNGQVMEWSAFDGGPSGVANFTSLFGAPLAGSAMSPYVRGDGWSIFVWRGTGTNSGHVFEAALKTGVGGWFIGDLTLASGNAVAASGDPAAYVPPPATNLVGAVVYASSTDLRIHRYELATSLLAWHDHDLTGAAGGPLNGKNPIGFARSDGDDEIDYTVGSKIMQIRGTSSFTSKDVTGTLGAPASAGGPHPYVRGDGANAIVYRASPSNHIMEIADKPGTNGFPLSFGDLSAAAGVSPRVSATDPIPYVRADGVSAVLYQDAGNGHLIELELDVAWFRPGHTGWRSTDLSVATGSPLPNSSSPAIANGFIQSDGTTVVIYRGGTGSHLLRLRFIDGAWQTFNAATDDLTPNGI